MHILKANPTECWESFWEKKLDTYVIEIGKLDFNL
jgi:hypothetical protein